MLSFRSLIISASFLFGLGWPILASSINCTGSLFLSEFNALEALFVSTNGIGWRWDISLPESTHWTFPSNATIPCLDSWQGLTCERSIDGACFVSKLVLDNMNLKGMIPPELRYLNQTAVLDLSTNYLVGAIPSELGAIASLSNMSLHFNNLTGTIPTELGALSSMALLYLSSNSLTGSIPSELGALANLTDLDLNSNYLTGFIPAELGALPRLSFLFLDSNSLGGSIPSELGDLSSLYVLDLYSNDLIGTIPTELGALTSLSLLYLSSNSLTGSIPSDLGAMADLTDLDLNSNYLTGFIPAELGALPRLSFLFLDSNSLGGSIPSELGDLSSLYMLDLYSNDLIGTIPTKLGALTTLTSLYLNFMSLTGSIPSELGAVSSLTLMYLNSNLLTGTIPEEFGNLSLLSHLNLNSNYLTGVIPNEFGALTSLSVLFLRTNVFTGTIPSYLGALTSLYVMHLNSNSLTGSIPSELGALTSLSVLYLCNNSLTGSIPRELAALGSLSVLYLYSNQLTRFIPKELGNLTSICVLNLYDNSLTGSIPSEFGALKLLSVLDLHSNCLTGSIPHQLGKLSSLLDLDISVNNLHGTFVSLDSFLNISSLVLSFNHFSGSWPDHTFETLVNLNASNNFFSSTLPSSLCQSFMLKSVDLTQNRISGSLPGCLTALPQLALLVLAHNGFSGNLDSIINLRSHSVLNELDVSFNRLTGTLPVSLFSLPTLSSLILSSNCFHGVLPSGICQKQLTELVMDGLSSGSSCKVDSFYPFLQGMFPLWFMSGSIPDCMWSSMPSLIVLHLAGNGFFGTLGDMSASTLSDLSLGSNQLTGTIPLSFQQRGQFQKLDLSSNRLGGTLSSSFAVSSYQEGLNLSLNRLSGEIPSTLMQAPGVNILNGNMFACAGSQLPSTDPEKAVYTCGSDGLNYSLLAWLCGLFCLTVAGFKLGFCNVYRLDGWDVAVNVLVRCILQLVIFSSFVSSAVFLSLKLGPWQQYSTHSNQYGWVDSAVYLQGAVPATYVLVLLLVVSWLTFSLLLRHSGTAELHSTWKDGVNIKLFVSHTVNLVVVLVVNIIYVYMHNLPALELLGVQFALSSFKIGWSRIAIPALIDWSESDFFNTITMTLVAFVGSPMVSAFFSQGSCFLYAVIGKPAVSYSYPVRQFGCDSIVQTICGVENCQTFTKLVCSLTDSVLQYSQLDVGWFYSYQCSSALVIDYVPVYVLSNLFSATVVPIATWIYLKFYPPAVDVDDKKLVLAAISRLLLNLMLLLTFALADPLLSCVIGVDSVMSNWFLNRKLQSSHDGSIVSRELSKVLTPVLGVMAILAGAFWSLFMLDMIGGVYGRVAGGCTMLIPLLGVWLLLQLMQRVERKQRKAIESVGKAVTAMNPICYPQDLDNSL